MKREIRTMVVALRNVAREIVVDNGMNGAVASNAADMLIVLDTRINTALMALRNMIDGGEEMRGHDSQITNIIEVLEKPV